MNTFTDNPRAYQSIDQENLLHRIVTRIRQSLELQEILNETVAEVRSYLGSDRVKIYRFHRDKSGEVIAESIHGQRLPCLLGLNFPADDIPSHARKLFVEERLRSIVDVGQQQIGSSPLNLSHLEHSTQNTEIHYRPVDPCHIEYLKAMGVQSSVVVPILHQETLWGLLVAHHSEPRTIKQQELQFLQLVADQVAIAIAQSELLTQARRYAFREATINQIATLLHSQIDAPLQAALERTVEVLHCSGGRLYRLAGQAPCRIYTCGEQPLDISNDHLQLEDHSTWQRFFTPKSRIERDCLWAIADLYQQAELRTLAALFRPTPIRGLLVVPLFQGQQCLGYLSLFRNQINTETLWAGQFDPDQRQLQPRNSFEAWRESKTGQAPQWSKDELELVLALGDRFSTTIQQQQLYEQVHALNTTLEQQVQERTLNLQKVTEQQALLAQVIGKIRASLDIDTIFQSASREIRQLLNVDRVGVFRFFPEAELDKGEFIAEDVLPGFGSALSAKIYDHCFGERHAMAYQQGRIQAVDDIYNAGLSECHIQLLSQFQVRANLIVPLLNGEHLWGLLCMHQCSAPRHWQPSEIEFVTQIAAQLGVALQQAELLAQTREQADQLTKALRDLQQAQTQLIQTEKMSSLGQLVAGVAHEINNPVNFIYGNLNHATSYAQDLLELLLLYQQHYPNPAAEVRDRAEAIDIDFLNQDLPKMLSSMKTGADRIRQIVLSLRNFSRFDQADMKSVDIHEGIDSTLLILQHRLKGGVGHPGIEVVKEYGQLPLVECYVGQLNQVFMNILSNAIDAIGSRSNHGTENREQTAGQIKIRTSLTHKPGKADPYVAIQIADNGMGMPTAVHDRIFDPFFTTKPVGQGTGLGLSISYQVVVDRHGGMLSCRSHPGAGTEFLIEIPLRQPQNS